MTARQDTPSGRRRDPLLGTVRILLSAMMIVAVSLSGAVLASIPLAFMWRARIVAELSQRAATAVPADIAYGIAGAQLLVAIAALLGFFFLRHLRRIIDTVAEGDPFIPENARRLNHMAWLAVAVEVISLPAGALAGWVAYVSKSDRVDIGLSFSGILLALILFVLARIFRQGAQMRDDLDGTV